jgi:hypothetical protein
MEVIPDYIGGLFLVTVVLCLFLFVQAAPKVYGPTIALLMIWTSIWCFVPGTGFFDDREAMPPRIIFMMGPILLLMIGMFVTKTGRNYIDALDLKKLTTLHIVRLPVEIVLMLLAIYKTIPGELTFEGRNFDIIMGLSALPMTWLIFKRGVSKKILLWWNVVGVVLLLNVVIHGVLSLPLPIQQFAFDQPNEAMLHAPYNLLPGVIVPIVMFSQLSAIRQLLRKV